MGTTHLLGLLNTSGSVQPIEPTVNSHPSDETKYLARVAVCDAPKRQQLSAGSRASNGTALVLEP